MTDPEPRTARVLLSCLGLAAAVAVAAPLTGAAAEPPQGLTIEISDDVDEATAGDELAVEATVTNSGADAVEATLVITAPDGAAYTVADGADVSGGDARWQVSIGAGESETVSVGILVEELAPSAYQLATSASVYLDDGAAPAIRAVDIDAIPDRANPVTPSQPDAASSEPQRPALPVAAVAGGAALLVLAVGAVVAVPRLRRRRTPQTGE